MSIFSLYPVGKNQLSVLAAFMIIAFGCGAMSDAGEPTKGTAKQIHLNRDVTLEIVYIPPGEFKMGSTAAEKEWAVGQEGGAKFSSGGGAREAFEGEPRTMQV